VTSESEMAGQDTLEQPPELTSEETQVSLVNTNHHPTDPSAPEPGPVLTATAIKDRGHGQASSSATSNTHRDLNQIIARAREEMRHLREELSRHEAQIASIARERDDIQQHYTHLRDNFMESVHFAAEEEILKTAHDLRETPGRIPKLLEPLQESITFWLDRQQAEREAILRQKVEIVEQQAAIIRQELIQERETLNAAREKFTLERQTFSAQMKAREAWLQHRWLAKAWSTAAVMFLVLPALQVYLWLQKADTLNIIIIPTTTCLVLTALINLVRSRKKPPTKNSTEKTSGEKK
jgi:hypothetical protein